MNNKTDNGRSLEAQKVRQESEFIKRIEDFARYMDPEYINGEPRSMMEDNDTFSAQVHELCEDDGADRSVEDLDGEISRKKKQLTLSVWAAVGIAAWSATLIAMTVVGIAHWMTTFSILLLMAFGGMLIGRDIRTLRSDLVRLRQQRKRAAGRQKIMSRISQLGDFLRQMRNWMEEDAGEDDDDD